MVVAGICERHVLGSRIPSNSDPFPSRQNVRLVMNRKQRFRAFAIAPIEHFVTNECHRDNAIVNAPGIVEVRSPRTEALLALWTIGQGYSASRLHGVSPA